jgi:hypothetical protein
MKRLLAAALALTCLEASAQQSRSNAESAAELETVAAQLRGPGTPAVTVVAQGANLGAALAAAQPGAVLELEAGPTPFVGNFRGRSGIVLRTRGLTLPDREPTEAECARMARVLSTNNAPAFQVPPSTTDVRLERLSFDGPANDVILVGAADNSQTTVDQVPRDIVIDQNCVAGVGAKNGIAIHSGKTSVTRNAIRDVARKGVESHAIVGWNGPGPYTITGNQIVGSSIGIFFGGAFPQITGNIPSDIIIRDNLLKKHDDWSTRNYAPKNAIECKACRRVVIEGNVVDGMPAGGQAGWAIVFTPSQMDGPALPPWAIVEDVSFVKNTVRRVGGVFNILGHGQNQTTAGRATLVSRKITIAENWLQCDRALGGHGALAQIGNGPIDVVFDHNTIECNGDAFLRVSDTKAIPGFKFTGNLQSVGGTYGLFSSLGSRGTKAMLEANFPGAVLNGNAIIAGHPTLRANLPDNKFIEPCSYLKGAPCVVPDGLVVDGYGAGAAAGYGRRK